MTTAKTAKTTAERADVAARLLTSFRPRPYGFGLSRSFDDCFKQGDSYEVRCLLVARARRDPELMAAIHAHGFDSWTHWSGPLAEHAAGAADRFAFMTGDDG